MLPENAITYDHSWDNKRVATFHFYTLLQTLSSRYTYFLQLRLRKSAPARFTTNTPAYVSILRNVMILRFMIT